MGIVRIFLSMAFVLTLAGAAQAQVDCDQAANQLTNCGFDSDLSGWSDKVGGGLTHIAGDGFFAAGSVEGTSIFVAESPFAQTIGIEQCVDASAGTDYDIRAATRITSGADVSCVVRIKAQDDTCANGGGSELGEQFGPFTAQTTSWGYVGILEYTAPVGTLSFEFNTFCGSDTGVFTARIDDAFVNDGGTVPVELQSFDVQ